VDHVVLVTLARRGVKTSATLGATLGASLVGVENGSTKTTAMWGVEKRRLFFSKKRRFVGVLSGQNVKNVIVIHIFE
jgi:hypothetical protein